MLGTKVEGVRVSAEVLESFVMSSSDETSLSDLKDFDASLLAKPARALKVLVVEDSMDSADMLVALVSSLGHSARVAYSGRAALQLLEVEAADLIVLDLVLPDLDGFDVARETRAHHGSKPFIAAVTAYSEVEMRDEARAAGCDLFLVKPFEVDVLRELLSLASSRALGPC